MAKDLSYKYFSRKYLYYLSWHLSLSGPEVQSNIGIWVYERVIIFDRILREIDAGLGIYRGSRIGNYSPAIDRNPE